LLVEPSDETSIAETLRPVLEAPELRTHGKQAGLARGKQVRFRNIALQIIAVYDQMMREEVRPAKEWQNAVG